MPQTSITDAPNAYLEGNIADTGFGDNVAAIVEDAAGIADGVFVKKGTTEGQCALLSATGNVTDGSLMGVVIRDAAREPGVNPQYGVVSVKRKGRIAVFSETTALRGQIPFVRFAAGTGTRLGVIRNDADTATAVQPPNGSVRVWKGCGAGGIAILELNLP